MEIPEQPLALCYVRVSTVDQAENGASLDAQATLLVEAAGRKGFRAEIVREEGKSGKSLTGRPALAEALARLDAGEAQALYAQRLDRLSRSVGDFAHLLERGKRKGSEPLPSRYRGPTAPPTVPRSSVRCRRTLRASRHTITGGS